MNFDSNFVITMAVLVFVLLGLLQDTIAAEVVMFTALVILVAAGVLPFKDAVDGFADKSCLAIGALYVVGLGLRSTGALESISALMFGKPSPQTPRLRLLAPVAALSAFMNNTPLVAFFLPIFVNISRRMKISPSQLLIPLSYATIMGGVCSKIGTSTNIVVAGAMERSGDVMSGGPSMGFFEVSWVGVPIAVVGLTFLVTAGRRLLPNRQDMLEYAETHPREYTLEMLVTPSCPLIGQTVRAGGLRDVAGLYLHRIERASEVISAVGPDEVLRSGDLLYFSGMASHVVDLQKIRGLVPIDHRDPPQETRLSATAATTAGSLDSFEGVDTPPAPPPKPMPRRGRQLCEVVISSTSPLLGQSIRDSDFRRRYNSAIIAVHRSGQKLEQKIGTIVLLTGDTLLVDADEDFVHRWRHSPDFVLVSGLEDTAPVRHDRAWIALVIFLAVLLGMSFGPDSKANVYWNQSLVAMCGAVAMLWSRCVRGNDAIRAIDMGVIVLVASSLGIGRALEISGAAGWISAKLLAVSSPFGPVAVLATVYVLTMVLSELLSNSATAALMCTLAKSIALQQGLDARPLMIAIAIAASCAFATPIGYQTNLMVMNPGGYRFRDYLKVGLPLDLICFIVAMIVIPQVWSLEMAR
ncbi:MAG: SLC13 family permease [Planctomycetaceae bacterium]